MQIDNKFQIGQTVFLNTDPYQSERLITSITVLKDTILYTLSFGTETSDHFDFEISTEKNVMKMLNN